MLFGLFLGAQLRRLRCARQPRNDRSLEDNAYQNFVHLTANGGDSRRASFVGSPLLSLRPFPLSFFVFCSSSLSCLALFFRCE